MDKTRKRILSVVGVLIIVLILVFFTNKKVIYRYMPNSKVNETVKSMKKSSKDILASGETGVDASDTTDTEEADIESGEENMNASTKGNYDYDLTDNDMDMNYVIVAMIAEDPSSFEGIKIKIKGTAVDLETTDTSGFDHYVVINDKQACCQQGLQYILEDTNQEYPKSTEEITVEGELSVFNSEEIPFPLAIIKNAKLVK